MRLETDGFTEGTRISMLAYAWPDNVRELGNRVRRAVLLADSPLLGPKDLGLGISTGETGYAKRKRLSDESDEKGRIVKALEDYGRNLSRAAEALGISRPTLYKKMDKYGLK